MPPHPPAQVCQSQRQVEQAFLILTWQRKKLSPEPDTLAPSSTGCLVAERQPKGRCPASWGCFCNRATTYMTEVARAKGRKGRA